MSLPGADHPAVRAAARHGLGLTPATARIVFDEASVDAVLAYARFDRLTGFLADAVLDGVVTAENAAVETAVEEAWHESLLAAVAVEALVVRVARLLDAAGAEWRLSKGAALAHLDYPDPGLRTFGDADVIVHPDSWTTALDALLSAGYRRSFEPLPGEYDTRYGKGATLEDSDGFEVDLHRRFAIGRFAVRSRMEDVFADAEFITLAGRPIPVLDGAHRLLHACFHASLGGFRELRAFRDVAQLLLVTGVDWRTTFATAARWRAEAVVAAAIVECWQRLDITVTHPAHERARATRIGGGDRRALAVFGQERPFRAQALTAVGRLPPWRAPRYLWTLMGPHVKRRSWTR